MERAEKRSGVNVVVAPTVIRAVFFGSRGMICFGALFFLICFSN